MAPLLRGNIAAPVNVGTTDQIKNGGLGLNSLTVSGSAALTGPNSYLNFGSTIGTGGYGIRDNAGTLEFKDNAGIWRSLSSAIIAHNTLNGLTQSAGRVSQIQFSDGTVMTSAPATTASNLYGSVHTTQNCITSAGVLRSIGSLGYLCQFTVAAVFGFGGTPAACPTGWAQLNNWSITSSRAILIANTNHSTGVTTYGIANSGDHQFADKAAESVSGATAEVIAMGCY